MEPRRRFRFLKALSEGSFGKVYLAEMVTGDNFSTVVAIKLLHGKWLGHEEIVMRSRDEARLLGLLRHQNIIRVEDLSSINGQCAVIMEFLDGVDLKHMITFLVEQGLPFPRRAALEAGAAIASALDAAYNHRPLQGGKPLRVIHRDIKPSNAMITAAGQVKVLDFGTARANFDDREAKTMALAFGSQAYMAPERMMGDPDTPAADVFSLGVTLWEILAGDRFGKIFIREARYQTALEQRVAQLDLSILHDDLAEEVRALLLEMLDYEPTARPSAAEVMEKLEEHAERAPDMGLRRLCRQNVKTAQGARVEEPEVTDDPLTGTTLVEDRSSAFVRTDQDSTWSDEAADDVGSSASLAGPPGAAAEDSASSPLLGDQHVEPLDDSAPMEPAEALADVSAPQQAVASTTGSQPISTEPPPDVSGSAPIPASGDPASTGSEPLSKALDTFDIPPDLEQPSQDTPSGDLVEQPSQPIDVSGPIAAPTPPEVVGFTPDPAPPQAPVVEPPPPKKGGGGLIFAIIGLLAVVVVGGGVVAFLAMSQGNGDTTPSSTTGTSGTTSTAAVPFTSDELGNVVLRIEPVGGGTVSITSALGFKETWNGVGERQFNKIPAGTYRTKVTPPGASAMRSIFDVQQDKTCTYTFDLAGGSAEWRSDGCE